jgi:hypothetical protein
MTIPKVYPFEFLPDVTVPIGATDRDVEASWRALLGFRQHVTTGQHERCAARPYAFDRVEHRALDGSVSKTTFHPNLLSPAWWRGGNLADCSPVTPGVFKSEVSA